MFSDKESEEQTDSGGCKKFHLRNHSGEMEMTSYDVFDGIQLVYNDVHMRESHTDMSSAPRTGRIIEIDHCSEGRLECSKGGDFFYLGKGDLAVHRNADVEHNTFFPTGHYHGITIVIDLDNTPVCLSCFLKDVKVQPENIAHRFCSRQSLFIARSNNRLDHIFAELYNVPEEVKKGYLKIKVLEILLFLSAFPIDNIEKRKPYTPAQVRLAKEACEYISEHTDKRIHVEELANQFHVSATQLQNCFRGVYGDSVLGYIRQQKIHSAAEMLRNTDKTVLEIAGLHGYENSGKFASLFAKIMGTTPNEYRKSQLT